MKLSILFQRFSRLAGFAAVLLIVPVAVACTGEAPEAASDTTAETAPEPTESEETAAAASDTIVDVAVANGSFDTLVAAVQAADLAGTLSAEGPYTVFAPTDDAFAALPEGVLDALLLPENKDTLTQILAYHVVPAEVPASAVETGAVASVAGEDLNLVADGSGVMVNDATVITADVMASNGIIHVIDSVLLPPSLDLSAL
ncbi:fasciclin domain-containing protein [Oscillatoria sp. CS-180]|uniref:fasciclin domain-containing protein n=1 Tax=Oscillatoria sp. CS-180 TaxID=3021720 RepID=UPI0023309C8A|nr:fasciclin domain-containing protein [Oscillatoria sp. CS-180]MDB9527138.1 fasciclin domain-containing protein [Oscillatoria sp. CS-180]